MFTPMLVPGAKGWFDTMQRSKVARAYIFTKRSTVSPNICDDKHLLVLKTAELLPNISDREVLEPAASHAT